MVKMRQEGRVENRAVSVAIGIDLDGRKDVLGLRTSAHEGAKFWLQVLTELRNRGVKDIFMACVDGRKGFPAAMDTVFVQAQVQLCLVPLVRASLNYVRWQERKQVAQDRKSVDRAATAEEAERQRSEFAARWDGEDPTIAARRQRTRERVVPFFAFPAEIRKVIDTTNALESLNMSRRKAIKTRGPVPGEESAPEGDVAGAAQRNRKVAAPAALESCTESLHPALARPHPNGDGASLPIPFAGKSSIGLSAVTVKAADAALQPLTLRSNR